MLKTRLIPALMLSLAMLAAGCSSNPAPSGSESAGASEGSSATATTDGGSGSAVTINAYACEPQHLVPTNTSEECGSDILGQVFTPLVTIDENKKAVFGKDAPDTVAEDVKANEDNTVWTITLKEGWTFHNGEKVDAESFIRSWNYAANPKNAQSHAPFFNKVKGYADVEAGTAQELAGLKAVDEKTIEITLEESFAPFSSMLGYNAFYPIPKAALEDMAAFNEAPIGNGPFKFEGQWQHNQAINLVANPDYKGTKPSIAGINFQIYEDLTTAYNELRAGNIDVLKNLPPEQQASFETDLGENLIVTDSSNFTFLAFPAYLDAFKEKKLRQALSMAIDREAINKAVWNGTRTPADDYVSPTIDGYREGACKYCTFNPEEAKKLYEEAGGVDGTLEIWFNSGSGHEEWIEAVSNGWKQHLGIQEVKFQPMVFAEYLTKLESKTATGPYRLGWAADYPSMENYLFPIFSTKGSSNYSGYSNPEVDELLKKGNAAPTNEESVKLYQQADDILLEDMQLIPIVFAKKFTGKTDRVDNLKFNFYEHIKFNELQVKE